MDSKKPFHGLKNKPIRGIDNLEEINFKFKDKKNCFIIAEAGVNHNGNLETAKELVDYAKKAGVNAIKFQTFKAKDLVTKSAPRADYQEKNMGGDISQFKMLEDLELSYEDFYELKEYCDISDIMFLSTPHTMDSAFFLEPLVPLFKIGSGDVTNIPLLRAVSRMHKPIVLSTGMSTIQDIRLAFNTIVNENKKQLILLHCTSNYPCPKNQVNLRAMKTIEDEFKCLVGYSDHTLGIDVTLMAVKLGAVIIEKHFTLDKNMAGPDHKASLDPTELKQLVKLIRSGEYDKIVLDKLILGSSNKVPNSEEIAISKLVRKSVIAKKAIASGTIVTREMLIVKRPGTGIEPDKIESLIGKKTNSHIKKNELISWEKLE